jgi:hypothetical protein
MKRTPILVVPRADERGRVLAELRRSGAAGFHARRIPRGRARRQAIRESREEN